MSNPRSRPPEALDARPAKSGRIEMRVTAEEDQLLSEAAELSHLSKTAFILSAAAERAPSAVTSR